MSASDLEPPKSAPAPPRPPPSPVGVLPLGSVTMGLIVANFVVAMADSMLWHWFGRSGEVALPTGRAIEFPPLMWWGHFSPALAIFKLQLWRFVTFQFLHAGPGPWHLLVNLIGIYFFGPLVEQLMGRGRFLAFYLTCGVGGAVGYLVMWAWSNATPVQLIVSAYVPLVGASAGLFGILVAAAVAAPNETVLVYGIIPMKLKVMAWVMLAIAVWTVLTQGHNAGGEAAHLGGAVVGWLLVRHTRAFHLTADELEPRMNADERR